MPTPTTIPITPGAGLLLDAVSVVISAQTVVREITVIGDPTAPSQLATVTAGGALNVYDAALAGAITANVLSVSIPSATVITLTPPTAAAIAAAIVANPPTVTATISGPIAVTGTFWQATQPISGAISFTVPQHVISDTGSVVAVSNFPATQVVTLASTTITGSVAVTGTFWQATQPISGTVTANAVGTLTNNNAAPAANNMGVLPAMANAAAPTYIEGNQVLLSTDLTGALRVNVGAVVASNNITEWNSVALGSPSAYGTSPGAVNVIGVNAFVTNFPASQVVTLASTTITGSVAVTGTFWQATQPVSGTFWQATQPVSGTVAFSNTTLAVTNAGTFAVQVSSALPAGTNVIGHVITDTGSVTNATLSAETTKIIGTVNQGTSPWIISGAVTVASTTITGTVAATQSGTWTVGISAAQTIAVTNTGTFAVQATLAAETTKVIGTVNQGTSPWVVSLASTTVTGTVAVTQSTSPWVDNLTQVAGVVLGATAVTAYGTAPAAANVPGVNAFITNSPAVTISTGAGAVTGTGGSLNVNVTNAAGPFTVAGNKTGNNAAPDGGNVGVLPALANALGPLWTEGDQVLESVDLHGGQRVMSSNIPEITAAWTSATAGNTVLTLTPILGYSAILVTLNQGTTITGGVVTFEASDTSAGTVWYPLVAAQSGAVGVASSVTYTLTASTNASFMIPIAGWAAFRVRLSTVITGSGTVNVGIQAGEFPVGPPTSNIAVRSGNPASALADNQVNTTFFTSTASVNDPLAVGDWVYGGAFSGAADTARQGWSKRRTPTVFRTSTATASGNTAVWTPGTGNKFRLLKLFVQLTDNASLASGAVLTINFQDATTSINISFDVFVPTTAVTTVVGDGLEQELDLGDFGILSAAANQVLNVNLSATLATGNVRVIAMGTEE